MHQQLVVRNQVTISNIVTFIDFTLLQRFLRIILSSVSRRISKSVSWSWKGNMFIYVF